MSKTKFSADVLNQIAALLSKAQSPVKKPKASKVVRPLAKGQDAVPVATKGRSKRDLALAFVEGKITDRQLIEAVEQKRFPRGKRKDPLKPLVVSKKKVKAVLKDSLPKAVEVTTDALLAEAAKRGITSIEGLTALRTELQQPKVAKVNPEGISEVVLELSDGEFVYSGGRKTTKAVVQALAELEALPVLLNIVQQQISGPKTTKDGKTFIGTMNVWSEKYAQQIVERFDRAREAILASAKLIEDQLSAPPAKPESPVGVIVEYDYNGKKQFDKSLAAN